MGQRQQNREFVRAIVNFAHSLGMNVVAEGIETVEQQLMLQAFCSEYGQGYLFAQPMKREDVVNWLRSATPDTPEALHK
jgi:FOG: EAL domain